MKTKKYIKLFLYIVVAFSLFHFVIWNLFTKHIFDIGDDYYIGDAGRMSYQVDSLFLRKNENNLTKKHINFDVNEKNVDVITIGDSFSNGIVQGKNPFYQDYIATLKNLKVMNIQNPTDNFIDAIIKLHKLGVLKKLDVKYVIIEGVERSIATFARDIDFDVKIEDTYLDNLVRPNFNRKFDHTFINRLNYNALLYNILYNYNSKAYLSNIHKFRLNGDYFSVKDSDILLCYDKDIKSVKTISQEVVEKINNNFNKLQRSLSEDGITLYFMPAVDKYDLYSSFIINNKYPQNSFFDLIRKQDKEYKLIDTKKILLESINNGEKDIYYSDDTHWSYIGSQRIIEKIKF